MREDLKYYFDKISLITKVSIIQYIPEKEEMRSFDGFIRERIYLEFNDLKKMLIAKIDIIEGPAIINIDNVIYFGGINLYEEGYLFIGPFTNKEVSNLELNNFLIRYDLTKKNEVNIPKMRFTELASVLGIIQKLISNEEFSSIDIIRNNGLEELTEEEIIEDKTKYSKNKQESDQYHHTYIEEVKWSNAVKEGRIEDALKGIDSITASAGSLSNRSINHYKNLAICAVTIATRAAIEGGVSPTEAYELSDIFIQRIDLNNSVEQVQYYFKEVALRFSELVYKSKRERKYSTYIEQCKLYIKENCHKKISLEELGEYIGINKTYLSYLFAKEQGVSMKEYLNNIRVDKAKNLLKYTDLSLIEISELIGFSSQSHFGKVFKEFNEITPKQYRDKYKCKEVSEDK